MKYADFHKATKGMDMTSRWRVLNRLTPGINWRGCSLRHIEVEFSRLSRSSTFDTITETALRKAVTEEHASKEYTAKVRAEQEALRVKLAESNAKELEKVKAYLGQVQAAPLPLSTDCRKYVIAMLEEEVYRLTPKHLRVTEEADTHF
jgi:hypothetical protein